LTISAEYEYEYDYDYEEEFEEDWRVWRSG
jgi:hypothetical protein